ncbi:MAG TPA: ATP-binding protein, partial [Thermoleophilia bacterium]|nr:ATP-binding protein [Thermoleophilia bacterium]
DPESSTRGMHLGLASMRERVRLVRGTLDIESAPDRGTTILAWVPTEPESQ